ncbi:hypothetical protein [Bdellovibrio sp. HCB337]|uniref:hypothetical protein n=1 Tax=Bdellovibrio sp. HCB337 TaxID=3394358 RepID=UPI0039A5B560
MYKFVSIVLFGLMPSFCVASNLSQARPADLLEDSEFVVDLTDPELLQNKEKTWQVLGADIKKKCTLYIRSHFDRAQAEQAKAAVYQFHQLQRDSTVNYYNKYSSDQFTLWLITENKDLPIIGLGCLMDTPLNSQAERNFTLEGASHLIGQPDFFSKAKTRSTRTKIAYELLPTVSEVTLNSPLRFAGEADERGTRLTVTHFPRIQDGKLIDPAQQRPDLPSCSLYYNTNSGTLTSYDVTLPAGEKFSVRGFREGSGAYSFYMTPKQGNYGMEMTCYFSKDRPQTFSEIQNTLGTFVEIK